MKTNPILLSSLIASMLSPVAHAVPIQQNTLSSTSTNYPVVNTTSQASSQLWELRQMVDQLQSEVRELRGQIEEKDNQLERLTQDFKNNYDDLDQRIELLNKKIDPDAATDSADTAEQANRDSSSTSSNVPAQQPQQVPTVAHSANNDSGAATASSNSSLSDREAYELAYKAYQQGGAAKAIQPMQNFIRQYPNSIYQSHAHYWLGEFNLAISPPDFEASKKYFKAVVNQYADSSKAPISLYRLGEISGNIDHNTAESQAYFQRLLQKYPNSAAASRAKTTYLR